ncbi:hypothetical protein KSP40_PGU008202 [Platanthera guangdongensis]|uniref:Uncharacterized protein n=1 Tax=Platanthera guangdongensis TaxID=2320717 RepID=A0ABR2MEG3_9ASPA
MEFLLPLAIPAASLQCRSPPRDEIHRQSSARLPHRFSCNNNWDTSKIGAEDSPSKNDGLLHYTPEGDKLPKDSEEGSKLPILQSTIAIFVSFAICKLATKIIKLFGVQGGKLPCITVIIIIFATLYPVQFGALAPTREGKPYKLKEREVCLYYRVTITTELQLLGLLCHKSRMGLKILPIPPGPYRAKSHWTKIDKRGVLRN